MTITLHGVSDAVTGAIAGSSLLFKLLPPPDKFAKWPRFQSGYGLVYTFVSWVAFNK